MYTFKLFLRTKAKSYKRSTSLTVILLFYFCIQHFLVFSFKVLLCGLFFFMYSYENVVFLVG